MINKEFDTLGIHLNRAVNWRAKYCNQNCEFCMENEGGLNEKNRATPLVQDLVEVVETAKRRLPRLKKVIIGGGEPTLHKDLFLLVREIYGLGLEVNLVTNGSKTRNLEYFSKLVECGIRGIHISIHAPYKEVHEKLTRTAGSFDNVICTLKNASRLGVSINTNTVVNEQNFRLLLPLSKFLFNDYKTIKDQVYYHLIARGNAQNNDKVLFSDLSMVKPYLRQLIDFASKEKISIRIRDFPLCIVNYRTDLVRFQKFYFGRKVDGKIEISQLLEEERYIKSKICEDCNFRNECLGLLKLNYEGKEDMIIKKIIDFTDSI